MKAIVCEKYGPPEVMRLEEVERPVPKEGELLVKVHCSTLNRSDCGVRAAKPFIVRFFTGLLRPKNRILGSEFAGEVEAVGPRVREFKPGEKVFGTNSDGFGTHAEFVCVHQDAPIAPMPEGMSFGQAAAICDGAILALSSLERVGLSSGQRILVYGASGSIGTAAVQLSRHLGAHVTAVCNTKNLELVKALGADWVRDYTRGPFIEPEDKPYDVIFDSVGKLRYGRCKHAIRRGGLFVTTDLGPFCQNPLLILWTSLFRSRRVLIPVPKYTREKVLFVKQLVEAGEYRAVVDRSYPLEQIVEATRYVESEQKTGNVVLTVR